MRSTRAPLLRSAPRAKTRSPLNFGRSRYADGRSTLYRPPVRKPSLGRRPYIHNRHHHHRPRRSHWFDPWSFSYRHHAFAPLWSYRPYYHPYYYPHYYAYPSSGFGLSWSSGSFGLSLFSYAPSYSTVYYDSWHCGGWGYSRLYRGGWRSGWYGGISYIYNPWPVYSTCYFYEPAPTVISTETVYVTQPAEVTYVTGQTAAPDSLYSAPASTEAEAAPQYSASAETLSMRTSLDCAGQPPDFDEYLYEAEYDYQPEDFDLSLDHVSYAESLDPETIWLSYAGLDYWETDTGRYNSQSTAAY